MQSEGSQELKILPARSSGGVISVEKEISSRGVWLSTRPPEGQLALFTSVLYGRVLIGLLR